MGQMTNRVVRQSVRAIFGALLLTMLTSLTSHDASAQSAWVGNEHAAVRLIAASKATGNDGVLELGLQFRLGEGWHSYWRSPGDAGFPATVDWAGSSNAGSSTLSWPRPHRFTLLGFETLGYDSDFILPIKLSLNNPGEPVTLKAAVDYLACAAICVPYHADLALTIPSGPSAPTEQAGPLADAMAQVPGTPQSTGLSLLHSGVVAKDDHHATLVAIISGVKTKLDHPDLYVEDLKQGVSAAAAKLDTRPDGTVALSVPLTGASAAELDGKDLMLTLVSDQVSSEFKATPTLMADAPPARTGIVTILVVALLGGFILNFMPCVLPVLSLKLLALARHAGMERRDMRVGFLATAAGIVVSFLVLATLAIVLNAVGASVGWGIQFQQPWFLAGMTLLLVLFALSLFDRLELNLPSFLSSIGSTESKHQIFNAFLSGAFATLLATPCSAPLVGTALGFALSAGPVEILSIFAALGIGFSAPYLVVALFPGLARLLPRPGRWMIILRRILGLLLLATALWLLSVLDIFVGTWGTLGIAVALVIMAMVLAFEALRRLTRPIVIASVIAVFAISLAGVPDASSTTAETGLWKPFNEADIPTLVASGKTVVVDVTAQWCVNCKVNELAVLDKEPLASRLTQKNVVAMRADWTRPNPEIGRYLASFGRYGIPFNAVYGPASPKGIALPELLSPGDVVRAMNEAGGVKTVAVP
jgi:suppressor for copper-sensitivity B